MNSAYRFPVLGLGLIAAGALGFYLGQDSTTSPPHSGKGGTPIPARDPASTAGLSSTALGRMIEGKNDFQRTRSLYDYSLSLNAETLPGAVSEAVQLPFEHRNRALSILFARWAELDPAAAVQYAQLLPKSANPSFLRKTALTAWADLDFNAALGWAQSLKKGEDRAESLAAVAGSLAKRDPAGAMKLIAENLKGREAGNAYDQVFSAWAENDFQSAYSAALGLTDASQRSRALRATLNQKVETDPRLVLETVRTAKLSELRWDLGNRAISQWAERDLAAVRDYVEKTPPSEMRDQQLQQISREIARKEGASGLEWVRNLPDDSGRDSAVDGFFSAWASSEPQAAIDAAHALPEGRLRDSAISSLAQNLIDTDLKSALALVKELPGGSTSESAYQQIAWRWAQTDPRAAADWLSANLPENNRWAFNQVIWNWSRTDPEAALDWAAKMPDSRSEQRDQMLGQALSSYSRNNPTAAVQYFEKLPTEQQKNSIGMLTSGWAYRDPAAASRWLDGLKDEGTRSNGAASIASTWGQRDPVAAARWLETIPAGNTRDSAVSAFAFSAVQTDPSGAMAWAQTIGDNGRREGAVTNVFSNWARKDRDGAAQWLNSTNLDDQTKKRLSPMLDMKRTSRSSPPMFIQ